MEIIHETNGPIDQNNGYYYGQAPGAP